MPLLLVAFFTLVAMASNLLCSELRNGRLRLAVSWLVIRLDQDPLVNKSLSRDELIHVQNCVLSINYIVSDSENAMSSGNSFFV